MISPTKITEVTGHEVIQQSTQSIHSVSSSRIVELPAIRRMVQSGLLVIAVGGGGIPVVEGADGLQGIDAVIDKDRSCARLALELKADILMILTAVDYVCIHFGKPDQKSLTSLSCQEARAVCYQMTRGGSWLITSELKKK